VSSPTCPGSPVLSTHQPASVSSHPDSSPAKQLTNKNMNPADMDPDTVDSSTMRKAISCQGRLLGQHEDLLKTLTDNNQAILNQISILTNQVTSLTAQLSQAAFTQPAPPPPSPAAAPPVSVMTPALREPYVPAPERYDGDLGSCTAFLTQCSLVFEQQQLSYATDRSRIAYLINSLTGSARAWGSAVWESQSALCFSYDAFVLEMQKVFDHPVRGKDAAKRLLSLRQGSRSVAELAIDFRTLAAVSGWNDEALQGAFQNALTDSIKDELVSRDEPESLDHLISLAIKIDNRLRERRREKAVKTPPTTTAPQHFPIEVLEHPRTPTANPEPMQLGRAQLTSEERARRINSRSCLYCGQSGHYISTCPTRPVKGPAHQ
uniref:CCHC-type domain-containing protein n=1 Tax=Gouania willdenowi TaxID=441366 RepID=A0A8C5DM91_GOUWI